MVELDREVDRSLTLQANAGTSHEVWRNPSTSYPHLAIARHFGVPYGVVLTYSDFIERRATYDRVCQQAFGTALGQDLRNAPSLRAGWMDATVRAVAELNKVRAMGLEAYIRFREKEKNRAPDL